MRLHGGSGVLETAVVGASGSTGVAVWGLCCSCPCSCRVESHGRFFLLFSFGVRVAQTCGALQAASDFWRSFTLPG